MEVALSLPVEWVGEEPPLELPPQAVLISTASPLDVARGANGGRAHEGWAVLVPKVAQSPSRGVVDGGAEVARPGPFGGIVVGESGAWQVLRVAAVGRLSLLSQGWLLWLLICFV